MSDSLTEPKISNQLIGSHLKDCPPQEAVAKNQRYYRVLKDGNLSAENFIPHSYMPTKEKIKETCNTCALSLCPTVEDAYSLIQNVSSFRNGKIAKVEIQKDHGRVHDNKKTHSNWWHPKEFDPLKIASKVSDVNEG